MLPKTSGGAAAAVAAAVVAAVAAAVAFATIPGLRQGLLLLLSSAAAPGAEKGRSLAWRVVTLKSVSSSAIA